jgi:hypothetical protein
MHADIKPASQFLKVFLIPAFGCSLMTSNRAVTRASIMLIFKEFSVFFKISLLMVKPHQVGYENMKNDNFGNRDPFPLPIMGKTRKNPHF